MAREVNKNFFSQAGWFYGANPPLIGYYYAPIIKLFGENEIFLHLFHLLFSLLVIISMFFLSQRFSNRSFFPVLFLISTPAFIIMSHNIMLDIPLISFFLSSIALFIYGTDNGNKNLLFLSGLFAACACLTKYSGICLIPILLVYSLLFSKKRSYLFLLIPVFLFLLWVIYAVIIQKQSTFFCALLWRLRTFLTNENLILRTFVCMIFLTGTSATTVFLLPYLLKNKINIGVFLTSCFIGLSSFRMIFFSEYSTIEKLILILLLAFSSFIILIVLKICLISVSAQSRNKDKLFLSFWFLILLFFTIFSNFIAARFVLLLFPPMFFLIFSEINFSLLETVPKIKKIFFYFICISIVLSTVLAVGDYYFAGIYRKASISLKKEMPDGSQIYFYGGDWGYYYYMMKEGYQPLIYKDRLEGEPSGQFPVPYEPISFNIKNRLFKKNYIIVPTGSVLPEIVFGDTKFLFKELEKLNYVRILVHRITFYGDIFLHSRKFHTGFYSHSWGLFPFYLSFKKKPIETFEIYNLRHSDGLKK